MLTCCLRVLAPYRREHINRLGAACWMSKDRLRRSIQHLYARVTKLRQARGKWAPPKADDLRAEGIGGDNLGRAVFASIS
jgi:hypothetical protein